MDLREASRDNYGPTGHTPRLDDINTGALQRIADATEKMAERYISLLNEVEWFRRRLREVETINAHLRNRIAGYKAAITRMKRRQGGGRP